MVLNLSVTFQQSIDPIARNLVIAIIDFFIEVVLDWVGIGIIGIQVPRLIIVHESS